MRRTSACCPPSPERRSQRAFTLLELLLVLALLALMAGIVAPAVVRGLQAAEERGASVDLQAVLAGLPVRAFGRAEALAVDAAALRRLCETCPPEWALSVEPTLQYDVSGVASGGRVVLQPPGREAYVWRVAPVSGTVARERSPES